MAEHWEEVERSYLQELQRKAAALDWLQEHPMDVHGPEDTGWLWEVWDWRNSRQICVGTTLLETIEAWMKAEGARSSAPSPEEERP
jgi:hypothetical protein